MGGIRGSRTEANAPFAGGSLTTAAASLAKNSLLIAYDVWYGTNRMPLDPLDVAKGFGSERSREVHHGKCEVIVPKSHHFGSVGSSWWKRLRSASDDRLRLVANQGMSEADFWADIRREIEATDESQRHSLVFLHGYNVSFEEAAIRAAQIGFDLKINGVVAFFSWPSQGSLLGYAADEATIEASEPAIADFLCDFASAAGDDRVHLLAHSMGNRGLLRSLQRIMTDVAEPVACEVRADLRGTGH